MNAQGVGCKWMLLTVIRVPSSSSSSWLKTWSWKMDDGARGKNTR